jgi:hypothetical protein
MKHSYEHESPLLPPGLSPHPSLPNPLPPGSGSVSSDSGVADLRKGRKTPLHPPLARGDRGSRKANPKVEYWRELLGYIDAEYVKKFGGHYPWSNLARKNLWNMARVQCAWEVMALWDLYLDSDTPWARRTVWSVYGMIRDAGRLMDEPGRKQLARKNEESLGSFDHKELSCVLPPLAELFKVGFVIGTEQKSKP